MLLNELLHETLTTDNFFDLDIEIWPEWNLNLRPLNSFEMF